MPPRRGIDFLLLTGEMKDVLAGLTLELIGPFLGKVVFVLEDHDQPGIVPIVRSSHSGHALQIERELSCWESRDSLRCQVRLIPGAAIVRSKEVISVYRKHGDHH